MNVREAKKIAGVEFNGKDQAGIERALASIKTQTVAARKAGDDEREKILSQAKQVFKKMIVGKCVECGATISGRAMHCRLHQNGNHKLLTHHLPAHIKPPTKSKPPIKLRKKTFGGILASWGFWAPPIQDLIKKWEPTIGKHWCEAYVTNCASSVWPSSESIEVKTQNPIHRQYALELMNAFNDLYDSQKPWIWILKFANGSGSGRPGGPYIDHQWHDVRRFILNEGGPDFSIKTLNRYIDNLGLTDPNRD